MTQTANRSKIIIFIYIFLNNFLQKLKETEIGDKGKGI